MKTVDILMNRIRSMQYALNMFSDLHPNSRFAYVALKWDEHREVERFVEVIKKGQVHEEVLAAHGITPEQLAALKSADQTESAKAFENIVRQVKESLLTRQKVRRLSRTSSVKSKRISTGMNSAPRYLRVKPSTLPRL